MAPVRAAMLALVVATALGCRAIRDDQETRPLPPPEPPPERTTQARAIERSTRTEAPPRIPRAPSPVAGREAEELPTNRDPTPSPNPSAALDAPAPPPEANPPAADTACIDRCQSALAACVTTPADGGLESCKSAFEACKSGC